MRQDGEAVEAARKYTAAHQAHYTTKDLHLALELYKELVVSFPDALEAEYARSQIRNVARLLGTSRRPLGVQLGPAAPHRAPWDPLLPS